MDLKNYIEYTVLKPDAALSDIIKCFHEAHHHDFYGICINPLHVTFVNNLRKEKNSGIKIITVAGFPLGANITDTKVFEAKNALLNGADEIDMVIDIGAIKDKLYNKAENDIKKVVESANKATVKVILETDLLTRAEIIEACKISANAGANFVKTSTGFVKNGAGATVENVKLMHETVSSYGLQVKASGGIKNKETAVKMIEAGASRIGTSSCFAAACNYDGLSC